MAFLSTFSIKMKLSFGNLLVFRVFLCGIVAEVASGKESWNAVFSYCQNAGWRFDNVGNPTTNAPPQLAAERDVFPLDPDKAAALRASKGNPDDAEAFLGWLEAERTVPGECAIVAGVEEGAVFVISEHGAESRCLRRYDMAGRQAQALAPTNRCPWRELVGPTFIYGECGDDQLAGLAWRSPKGIETEWRDTAIAELSEMLKNSLDANGVDFLCRSPANNSKWIVAARFRDRPPAWLSVDVKERTWHILQEFGMEISPTIREVFRYTASDGTELCAIFTRPDGPGPFRLVVFPHGGPGALSMTDFDERVWALCDAGFAVFQPNYRGSAGFGKQFRFSGWGAEGIKRAMLDIKEGVDAIRCRRDCGIANNRPVLLGGSWGGYCALGQLAMFPGYYGGAVSFFGAFDLPALLQDEIRKATGLAVCEAEIERRSLIRQFGDPGNAEDMAALASISPLNLLNRISEPVALFHNREDTVIAFSQSERLFSAMTNKEMRVDFHAGDGGHGFLPSEEATIYATLVDKLRQWGENKSGGR